ncbi:uncharacterized protein KY384_007009 [Bacidia gigantensis]|uniref:uncharacterized protein n=1 Tax=Bacidia gigantensis TaxID=2732470 RepID=UPI001D057499|nr:uncharacterized protein KY384_007009 [Bacidia gigantensis]KAG8528093.1 hypothetical protein KY384_007009 [Bacidia gigantensis]
MAPVHRKRAASVASGTSRHEQAGRRSAPYKVIFEEITQKKKLLTYLTHDVNPPRGYTFIPAGDSQLNKRCRKYSKYLGLTVYIVSPGARSAMELSREVHRIGHHFPTFVVDKACHSLGVTLTTTGRVAQSQFAFLQEDVLRDKMIRGHSRLKKNKSKTQGGPSGFDSSLPQAIIDSQARETLKDLFPKIPERDMHEIISRAFDKNKGLVGTAEGTSLVRRANLAVVAHIRHVYTNYDELLQSGTLWHDARRGVEQFTLDKLVSWRDEDDGDDKDDDVTAMLREVIVISDDEKHLPAFESRPRFHNTAYQANEPPAELPHAGLIEIEDEDDSDDEDYGTYTRTTERDLDHEFQYDPARKVRQDEEMHARWNAAVHRHKRDPNRAHVNVRNAIGEKDLITPSLPGPTNGLRPIPGLDGYNRSIVGVGKQTAIVEGSKEPATFSPPPIQHATMSPLNKDLQRSLDLNTINSSQTNVKTPNTVERFHDQGRLFVAPTTNDRPEAMQSSRTWQTLRPASIHGNILPSVETEHPEALSTHEGRFGHVNPMTMGQSRSLELRGLERRRNHSINDNSAPYQAAQQHIPPIDSHRAVLVPLDQSLNNEVVHLEPIGLRRNASKQEAVPTKSHQAERFQDDPRQILLPRNETSQIASRDVEAAWTSWGGSNPYPHQLHKRLHNAEPTSVSSQASAPVSMQRSKLVRLSDTLESQTQATREPNLDWVQDNTHSNNRNGGLAQRRQVFLQTDENGSQGPKATDPHGYAGRLLDSYNHSDSHNPMAALQNRPIQEVETYRQQPRLVRLGEHQERRQEFPLQQPLQMTLAEGQSLPRQIKLPTGNPFEERRMQHPYLLEA